jgi:dihydroflavonol-4-reductase
LSGERVLVTGGSGFVGAHCIVALLRYGYSVRTTVRSVTRAADVRETLMRGGAGDPDVEVVEADLNDDAGWLQATSGCRYVLHVASPFPASAPKDPDELIVPARDGALRVLRAAREAGVERVVLTSSFAAVGYGAAPPGRPFTEEDWTDADAAVSAYVRSKTLAERAAWDFVSGRPGAPELAVVNPVGIFGPALGPALSSSVLLIQQLLTGAMPGTPRLHFSVVDVRDVADLHLRAMTQPAAAGERFLATAGEAMSIHEIALTLREELGEAAARVPTRELPDLLVRLASLFDARLRQFRPELGRVREASSEKARKTLGWAPRASAEALAATGASLIELGLVS